MASNMVQIPNKGRELAVIQSVSYLATLLKDIKTHCFVVWQAEIDLCFLGAVREMDWRDARRQGLGCGVGAPGPYQLSS